MEEILYFSGKIKEGEPVKDLGPINRKEVTYPLAWFKDKKVPQIRLRKPAAENVDIFKVTLYNWSKQTLEADMATYYLYTCLVSSKPVLKEDWISYGIVLGEKDKPFDLHKAFDITFDHWKEGYRTGAIDEDKAPSKLNLFLAIASVHRIVSQQGVNDTYMTTLTENLKRLMNKETEATALEIESLLIHYRYFLQYEPYKQMLAIADMVLNKFPEHEFAQGRFGTIITRYKDCSALVGTAYLTELLGLTFLELSTWIWHPVIAKEYMQILEPGNEMDKYYGYGPYFTALGLSDRSPYAASSNPNLHLLIHVIGTIYGLERSRNARAVSGAAIPSVIRNAATIAHIFREHHEETLHFATKDDRILAEEEIEEDRIEKETWKETNKTATYPELPSSTKPVEWFLALHKKNMKLPEPLFKSILKKFLEIESPRKGSVGELLKTYAKNYS